LAVLQGLLRFPAVAVEHGEALAALALSDRTSARLRDLLLEAAVEHSALDPPGLLTILADKGASHLMEEVRRKRGLAFSFTRRDAEPDRACRDLALVIETLAARPGLDAALAAATARLKTAGDEAAFQEQQRLREARDEADRRLSALMEAQGD
jgi:DNA primase